MIYVVKTFINKNIKPIGLLILLVAVYFVFSLLLIGLTQK